MVEQEKDEELVKVFEAIREGETLEGVKFTEKFYEKYTSSLWEALQKFNYKKWSAVQEDATARQNGRNGTKINETRHNAFSTNQWTLSVQQNLQKDPWEILLRRSRNVL